MVLRGVFSWLQWPQATEYQSKDRRIFNTNKNCMSIFCVLTSLETERINHSAIESYLP